MYLKYWLETQFYLVVRQILILLLYSTILFIIPAWKRQQWNLAQGAVKLDYSSNIPPDGNKTDGALVILHGLLYVVLVFSF